MVDPTVTLFDSRLYVVMAALLMQAVLGGPRHWYHALGVDRFGRVIPRFVRMLERKLNRSHRTNEARRTRGALLVGITLSVCLLLAAAVSWLAGHVPDGLWLELVMVAILLPLRPAADRAVEAMRALSAGKIDQARKALAGTAWRNAALLDVHGLARAPIENLAVTFSEKLVGPVFWYLLLGLPGAVLSRAVRMLDEMVGASPSFGIAAAACNNWFHYLPTRLGGLMLATAALFAPYGRLGQAFLLLGRTEGRWKIPPGQWAITAMAGGLGLALGGPASVMAQGGAWIGRGSAQAQPRDIRRALQVYALACLLLVLSCALLR